LRKFILLIGVLVVLGSRAQIDTDRPAFTNSTQTVTKNKLQLESGIHSVFSKNSNNNKNSSISLPNTMVRFGLSDNSELRLELPSVSLYNNRTAGKSSQGAELNNLSLGFKSKIVKENRLNISGLGTVFFQEKNREWIYTLLQLGVNLSLPVSYSLNKTSSIAGTLYLILFDGFTTFGGSIVYGKFVSPKLWLQGEYYNSILYDNWGSTATYYGIHFGNISSQYTLTDRCKIDLTLGSLLKSDLGNNTIIKNPNIRSQFGIAYLF
jgi:hypothetical protein